MEFLFVPQSFPVTLLSDRATIRVASLAAVIPARNESRRTILGTLDTILQEVGDRFALDGTKTKSLLSGFLSIIHETPNGLSVFLDGIRNAGYGETVSSWLYDARPRPISGTVLEASMGRDHIVRIASKAGLSVAITSSAIAFMLPGLVRRLTPGGVILTLLPPDILPYVRPASMAARAGAD